MSESSRLASASRSTQSLQCWAANYSSTIEDSRPLARSRSRNSRWSGCILQKMHCQAHVGNDSPVNDGFGEEGRKGTSYTYSGMLKCGRGGYRLCLSWLGALDCLDFGPRIFGSIIRSSKIHKCRSFSSLQSRQLINYSCQESALLAEAKE